MEVEEEISEEKSLKDGQLPVAKEMQAMSQSRLMNTDAIGGAMAESESPQTETPQPTPQYFPTPISNPATGDVPPTEQVHTHTTQRSGLSAWFAQLATPVNLAMLQTCVAGLTQSNQTNLQSVEVLTSGLETVASTLCVALKDAVGPINASTTKNQEVLREVCIIV